MPYIGQQPEIGAYKKLDSITVVNGQAAYTLQYNSANYNAASANHLIVSLNGVIQAPQNSFSVSGSTLTFASNLSTGDSIDFILALGDVLSVGVPSDGTITSGKLSSNVIRTLTEDTSPADDDLVLTFDTSASALKKVQKSNLASQGVYESALLHVRQEESSGGGSGSMSTSAWNTRTLNTVMTNEITSASLSSNQITLPSGTYYIYAYGLGYACTKHQTKLYNTTDASDVLLGNSSMAHATYGQNTHSIVSGRFTISAQKVFELQSKSSSARATNGLGVHAGLGTEVYTDANIWKVG